MKLARFLPVLLSFTLASTLPALAAERIYEVSGVIRQSVDKDNRILIAHGDIPDLMPAMTMPFTVGNGEKVADLKPGDKVNFRLHVDGIKWFVSSFEKTGEEVQAEPAAAPKSTKIKRVREGDPVPGFSLVDQANQPYSAKNFQGKFTVLTFIFTRCPVPEFCPAMTLRFAQLQDEILAAPALSAKARLLSITLDPEFDRPNILKAYGEANGADFSLWQFVTGTESEIKMLTRTFSVYNERNGATLDHTLCTALIGPDGRVRQIWRGNSWKPEDIVAAINAAPNE